MLNKLSAMSPRKKLIVMYLVVAACMAWTIDNTVAVAQYQQHQVARQSYCDSMGKVSEQAYMGRILERPKQKYLDMAKEQLEVNDRNAEILRYAIDYGYDKATGLKDSNMGAWAYCMDKSR